SLVFRPDPGRAEGCDLQPVTAEPPIALSYATSTVQRGCVSSSSLGSGHEVHVLSIEWSKPTLQLSLRWMSQESPFLWGAPWAAAMKSMSSASSGPRLLLALQDAHLVLGTATSRGPEPLVATGEGQLLAWARETYGGITSYSKVRDPRWVQLRLGEDAGSPPDCIPREHFDAVLHLETEVFFHGVKSCSHGDAQSTKTAHIVHLQPEPSSPITEVNLSLTCPERAMNNQILILQSRANITWSLSVNNCHIQFLVSWNYKLVSISSIMIPGELLPDTEQGLVAKAFEKNYSVIASYSAIPTSTRISLEIQEHEVVRRAPATSTPLAPTVNSLAHMLLLMLEPWKCTDETMEIVIARSHLEPIKDVVNITLRDISCQAEKNATHFMLKTPLSHCGTSLEGRGHANNELILSLATGAVLRSVRVAFQCKIPRELFLRLFPTAAFEAPQTELEVNKETFVQCKAGLQVSVSNPPCHAMMPPCWSPPSVVCPTPPGDGAQLGAASLVPKNPGGSCPVPWPWCRSAPVSPQPPPPQNNTIFEKVLEVMVKDGWRLPNNRGLGLAAVLGITFGAFLIGALLTAGLWYIYSHTRPISKLQPVSSTAPASESSSTNHSIGSTQSTPCSTSSMA
ncbi:EGLN protein, partial [Ciccaba nigrolineata]|nr:EGLN protein [Ciccaba nigrolineata]